MRWEDLTSDRFPAAVRKSKGVCILVLGVLERHGPHMPLGTDMLCGLHLASEAAKREPAVVFPPWFLGQIYEAKCFPGTVTVPPRLLLEMLFAICDEIGRNGFTKIILNVAHGGNYHMVKFLSQCFLDAPRPYSVYVVDFFEVLTPGEAAAWKSRMDVVMPDQHADEMETSLMMAYRPELVDMKALRGRVGASMKRLAHLKRASSPFGWYANFPEHYAGDARLATASKGRAVTEIMVNALAEAIREVKSDAVAPRLAKEFFGRELKIRRLAGKGRKTAKTGG